MTLFRRYSSVVLAASALLLAACGSEAVGPSDPTPTDGAVNDNPLLFFISPENMGFYTTDGTVPGPQTLATTGLVAIGSMVTFDRFSYGEDVQPWLRIAPVPTFQREPLAWLSTVWVDPAAYNSLPVRDWPYTAIAHANVIAAQNTPQHLRVQLCNDPDGCYTLRLGDVIPDDLPTSQEWDRGDYLDPQDDNNTGYYFRDWRLFVEPGQTVYVHMNGGGCGVNGGTLDDPYLYLYDATLTTFLDADDDTDCLNSQLVVHNPTGSVQEYVVRATSFGSLDTGTYTMVVDDTDMDDEGGFGLREGQSAVHPLVAAKRDRGN